MFRRWLFPFLLLSLPLLLSGCFRRWRMTERDLQRHYATRPARPTYHTIDAGGMNLFCAAIGADTLPPLLLIHGAPGSWYGYLRLMDDSLLYRRYQIIAVDRPGYGRSKKKGVRRRQLTDLRQQAEWIAASLQLNRSGKPAVVLGRSFGAPIAARLAILYPENVRHLYMLAPAIDPDREKFWWFSRAGRFPLIRLFLHDQINMATDEKFAHVRQLRQLDTLWTDVRATVTVMQGGRDWLVDPENLNYARRVLTGRRAEFIYLPQAGHLISNSHPALVRELLLRGSECDDVIAEAP